MASVAHNPAYRKMTVEEFLALKFEGRAELEDGVLYMMAGGSPDHAAISANVIAALRTALRGTGCQPFTADLAVRTGPATIRYPDASVHCAETLDAADGSSSLIGDPRMVVEVLSPSTSAHDQKIKLEEYRGLAGLGAVLFVDPKTERVRLVERTAPEAWSDRWLAAGADVTLNCLGVTLRHADMFDRG